MHIMGFVAVMKTKYAYALVKDLILSHCRGSLEPYDSAVYLSTASEEAAGDDFEYRRIIYILLYICHSHEVGHLFRHKHAGSSG